MIDYALIRLLYVVIGLTYAEIAAVVGESSAVIELAVGTDLRLVEEDRHHFDGVPLHEKLKIFDLERIHAFQASYTAIESKILARILTMLSTGDDEMLTPRVLHTFAHTVVTLRQPAFRGYDEDDTSVRMSAHECSTMAIEAAKRLEELRALRMV